MRGKDNLVGQIRGKGITNTHLSPKNSLGKFRHRWGDTFNKNFKAVDVKI
jgi:hypothetical protein